MRQSLPRVCGKLSRYGGVTAATLVGGPADGVSPAGHQTLWSWPASAIAHAIFLVLILTLWTVRPVVTPPVISVDVQVLTPSDYQAATAPRPSAPAALQPTLETTKPSLPLATAPASRTPPLVQSRSFPTANSPAEMVHASRLYSTGLLREPASLEVRNTLPTLAPYERMTQLCNIEATEQIKRALKGSNPETVSASAFAETNLINGVLKAPGAAYRSHAKWFAIAFDCKVRSDLAGVDDFSFRLGPPIPKDQWEAHDLIGIDEDDENLGDTPPQAPAPR